MITLRHPTAGTPIYVYDDQRSIPMQPRRCRQCPTWLSAYNQQPICSACEDKRARFLMANPRARVVERDEPPTRSEHAHKRRLEGATWPQIATDLDYPNELAALKAVTRWRKKQSERGMA